MSRCAPLRALSRFREGPLETFLIEAAEAVANVCEAACLLAISVGTIEILVRGFLSPRRLSDLRFKKKLWIGFASWIVLSLEFALAADIVATAIAPDWEDIGQLAAIAAIRTLLNFFLERDLEEAKRSEEPASA